jgi:hypothetical protein
LLSFANCSFPETASGLVARAFEKNTTLTTVKLIHGECGEFSKTFYDAFAVTLLINTTLATLELDIPRDEAEAALMAPVFLALGMNKTLKSLLCRVLAPPYGMGSKRTRHSRCYTYVPPPPVLKNFRSLYYPHSYLFFASVRPSNLW